MLKLHFIALGKEVHVIFYWFTKTSICRHVRPYVMHSAYIRIGTPCIVAYIFVWLKRFIYSLFTRTGQDRSWPLQIKKNLEGENFPLDHLWQLLEWISLGLILFHAKLLSFQFFVLMHSSHLTLQSIYKQRVPGPRCLAQGLLQR